MREILFRGKRMDNKAWEDGSLVITRCGCYDQQVFISDKMTGYHTPVIPETVCQFTGLTDKNGRKIFEGDIVKGKVHELNGYRVRKGVIEYHDTGFIMNLKPNSDSGYDQKNVPFEREVIGNVFDNPGLLEV